jgi:polyribonucleotide nucleotidyltransferase
VHISELKHGRTDKTEDVVKKGETVKVKLIDRDERGRLRLSMKALVPKPEAGGDGASPFEGSESRPAAAAPAEGGEAEGSEAGQQREERPRRPRSRAPRSGGGRSRE